eukprot:13171750-Alexandrium_andersonii.AAC.1
MRTCPLAHRVAVAMCFGATVARLGAFRKRSQHRRNLRRLLKSVWEGLRPHQATLPQFRSQASRGFARLGSTVLQTCDVRCWPELLACSGLLKK